MIIQSTRMIASSLFIGCWFNRYLYIFIYLDYDRDIYKSSYWRCLTKKVFLKILQNSQEKHLCQSLFFNKVAGLSPSACNFIEKETWHRCFPVNFPKFLRTPFFIELLWWLLLDCQTLCNLTSWRLSFF